MNLSYVRPDLEAAAKVFQCTSVYFELSVSLGLTTFLFSPRCQLWNFFVCFKNTSSTHGQVSVPVWDSSQHFYSWCVERCARFLQKRQIQMSLFFPKQRRRSWCELLLHLEIQKAECIYFLAELCGSSPGYLLQIQGYFLEPWWGSFLFFLSSCSM